MSLNRDDIDALQNGGNVTLTLDDGDVTIEAFLETNTEVHRHSKDPDVTNLMGTSEPVSSDDIDGLDVDLETTQVSPSVRFTEEDGVNVETESLKVVTDVEDAGSPYTNTDIWADDKHTVEEFTITGIESAE